jgi:hypothetical protein
MQTHAGEKEQPKGPDTPQSVGAISRRLFVRVGCIEDKDTGRVGSGQLHNFDQTLPLRPSAAERKEALRELFCGGQQ